MSKSPTLRRLAVVGGTAAAATVLAVGPAFAGTITAVNPSPLVDNATATVTGTGFTANGAYRVGICSTATYGLFSIPACGDFADVTADAGGTLSASFTALVNADNNHYSPGNPVFLNQPATVDCSTAGACEVLVTSHSGTSSVTEASAPATF
jgi:hypothetical protein